MTLNPRKHSPHRRSLRRPSAPGRMRTFDPGPLWDRWQLAGRAPPRQIALPGKRILVVEDDAFARGAMSTLLEAEGYQITSAANGWEALGQLRGPVLPHLILLDLVMPVMDGLEFCRRQSKDGRLTNIPVLIVSARDAVRPDWSLVPQIVGHLVKPVVVEDMLAHVRQCC